MTALDAVPVNYKNQKRERKKKKNVGLAAPSIRLKKKKKTNLSRLNIGFNGISQAIHWFSRGRAISPINTTEKEDLNA